MGFFDDVETTTGEVDLGGSFDPIPKGTQLLAVIEGAAWDSYEGVNTIKITWQVLKPASFANRKVFQKIKVEETDQGKRKRQMTMLAAIATNAGGGLLSVEGKPTDADLSRHLLGKQMLIKVEVWETDDKKKSGNWICAVSPKAELPPQQQADDLPVGGVTNGGGSVPF